MSRTTESHLSCSCCWGGYIAPVVGVVVEIILFSQAIGRNHHSNVVQHQHKPSMDFVSLPVDTEQNIYGSRHTMRDRWISVFKAKEVIHNTPVIQCC